MTPRTTVTIPIRTVSEANSRGSWHKGAERAAKQRHVILLACRSNLTRPALPCVVVLTRIAPRLLDDDNLARALKACRDSVASWVGIDDGDPRVNYLCRQVKGASPSKRCPGGEYAVRIEVHAGMVVETRIVAAQAAGGGQ